MATSAISEKLYRDRWGNEYTESEACDRLRDVARSLICQKHSNDDDLLDFGMAFKGLMPWQTATNEELLKGVEYEVERKTIGLRVNVGVLARMKVTAPPPVLFEGTITEEERIRREEVKEQVDALKFYVESGTVESIESAYGMAVLHGIEITDDARSQFEFWFANR